jgi:hypothetical protein
VALADAARNFASQSRDDGGFISHRTLSALPRRIRAGSPAVERSAGGGKHSAGWAEDFHGKVCGAHRFWPLTCPPGSSQIFLTSCFPAHYTSTDFVRNSQAQRAAVAGATGRNPAQKNLVARITG